jgi:phosphoglycerol transferase MdoB-like AlkP superfamily enzyme
MSSLRFMVVALLTVACSASASRALAFDAAHDLAVVGDELPQRMAAGTVVTVPVQLTNRGRSAWSSTSGFFLAYHWYDASGEIVEWDGRRSRFASPVRPGETIEIVAQVEAPTEPGDYQLMWDVVQEGVLWVSEVDPTPVRRSAVTIRSGHAFTVNGGLPPWWLVAGRSVEVTVQLGNRGERSWRGDGGFALAYRWLDRNDGEVTARGRRVPPDGRRTRITEDVAPGATTTVRIDVEAPARGGRYRLQWDMVEEGVCWFSERGGAPEPSHQVVVFTSPLADPRWWAVACLLAAATVVATMARWRVGRSLTVIGAADAVWCAVALCLKQSIVLFQAGAALSPRGWIMTAASAVLVTASAALLPSRWRGWARWTAVAAATLALWGDAVYLRFFGDLPTTAIAATAGQLNDVEASIWSLFAPADVWFWLDLLPGAVLVLAAGRVRRNLGERRPRVIVASVAVVVLAAMVLTVAAPRGVFEQVFRRVWVARDLGVLNFHVADGRRALTAGWRREPLDDRRRLEIVEWFEARAPVRAATGPLAGAGRGMNLVMIQVESLQGFVIGLEINGREVTPLLNDWRREALWFSNLSDQSLAGRSSDSELATQISLLPSSDSAAAFEYADNTFTGLAQALGVHGYETVSAVPYEASFWNRRVTHSAYGFSRSLFDVDFESGERIGWGLNDRDFLLQMAARMERWPQPFAAYLLTLSLHHPFEGFPAQHRRLDVGRWQGRPFGEFLHTMHFFDRALSDFLAELDRSGLLDHTVVAVWGDHDAGFEWAPEVADAMGVSFDPAGWYMSQEVPLFIRVPGRPEATGERTTTAGHLDVAPTLLALLGVDPMSYAFVGRNLLNGSATSPVVGEYGCWRDGELLFLQSESGTLGSGRCIDASSFRELPVERCRTSFAAARRGQEISRAVLEHDLQGWLHEQLLQRSAAP